MRSVSKFQILKATLLDFRQRCSFGEILTFNLDRLKLLLMFPTHPFHVNVSMVGVFQQFGILYRSSQMHRFLLVHNCVCFLTERDVGFTTQVYFYIGNDSQHLCSSSKAQMTYQLVRMVTNGIVCLVCLLQCEPFDDGTRHSTSTF